MLQRLMSVFLAERSTAVLNVQYKDNAIQLKTDSIPLTTYNKHQFFSFVTERRSVQVKDLPWFFAKQKESYSYW
jgi:hypothetical protein